jgi:hypothetical protein
MCKFPKPWYIQKSIFFQKRIFPITFGPSSLSAQPRPSLFFFQPADFPSPPPLGLGLPAGPAHPHGPTGQLLLPPTPETSAPSAAGRPRAAPRVDPDTSTGRKENNRINPLHSPITRCRFPLFNNRYPAPSTLAIEAPSTPAIEDARPRLRPIKADPALSEASHTSNALSPSPHRALAVALPSQSFRRR